MAEILNTNTFERAKRLSDYIAMLTRIAFLAIFVGVLQSRLDDDIGILRYISLSLLIAIMYIMGFYLSILVNVVFGNFIATAAVKAMDDIGITFESWFGKALVAAVIIIGVLATWGLGTTLRNIGEYQANRLLEKGERVAQPIYPLLPPNFD